MYTCLFKINHKGWYKINLIFIPSETDHNATKYDNDYQIKNTVEKLFKTRFMYLFNLLPL